MQTWNYVVDLLWLVCWIIDVISLWEAEISLLVNTSELLEPKKKFWIFIPGIELSSISS